MNSKVMVRKDKLAAFCRANGITLLSVFGSALREDFSDESDIDLLIDMLAGYAK